ncbi:MAG TPA: alpha/beta hydrolase [Trueperaceae bacterium]|nr:alpha/beta hydrolase [Trueperaceae bacterium]
MTLPPVPADPLFSARVHGGGPTRVIAVHGWMAASDLFEPLIEHLDVDKLSVCFPDCRGYGMRRAVHGAMTIEEIASDVLALADSLGWSRFHVLGHSMAGMAAQRLMVDAPGRLQSAVLLAPVPATGARVDDVRRRSLLAAITDPSARLALIDDNTGGARDREWLDRVRHLSLAGTEPGAMERYLASWSGPGFARELEGNVVPASVVIGRLDPGTPEAEVRVTFRRLLANVRFDVLDGVGHYAMQEEPAMLVGAMTRHFEHVSESAASNRS